MKKFIIAFLLCMVSTLGIACTASAETISEVPFDIKHPITGSSFTYVKDEHCIVDRVDTIVPLYQDEDGYLYHKVDGNFSPIVTMDGNRKTVSY